MYCGLSVSGCVYLFDTLMSCAEAAGLIRCYNLHILLILSPDDEDDAMVRGRWRKMIRVVDEPEGCEWMDVSAIL